MEKKIDITVELQQERAMNQILRDTLKSKDDTLRHMKHIIIALIICFFGTVCVGFGGFVWYESQFEYTSDTSTEVYTEGDNANAEYNDVEGNQYNDEASHVESGDK